MILDSYVMNFHEFSTVCVSFVEYFPAFQNYVWNTLQFHDIFSNFRKFPTKSRELYCFFFKMS